MARYEPKINHPLESMEHEKKVRKDLRDHADELSRLRGMIERLDKSNAAGAQQTSAVHREVRDIKDRVTGSRGIPDGGFPGEVIRQDKMGDLRWFPNMAGNTPRLYIHLEDGDPSYTWDVYTTETIVNYLPEVVFTDNGKSFDVVGWGSYVSLMPINYDIQVAPHSDGEVFQAAIPSNAYYIGSGEVNNFTVTIHNSFATGFTADVRFGSSDLLFGGANQKYADSRLVPWRVDTDPGSYDNIAVLAPNDQVSWVVQLSPVLENLLTPAGADTLDELDRVVSYPLDYYYWQYVQSRKHTHQVHASGTVTVAALKEVVYNDSADSRRLGLIRATVGTAPTGAALEVDVKVDGVVVGTVSIAAGDTTASVEPDGFTHGPTGTYTVAASSIGGDAVIWFPGDALSFEVTQVGSTIAGSDLTVQVWAG